MSDVNLLGLMRQAAAGHRSLCFDLHAGGSHVGRVVMVNGYVAWATCRDQHRILGSFLLRIGGVTREQLVNAIQEVRKSPKRQLGGVLEEMKLMERPTLRRCLLLHVRAAVRTLLSFRDARVSSTEITTAVDETLLIRFEEVLPAKQRRAFSTAGQGDSQRDLQPVLSPEQVDWTAPPVAAPPVNGTSGSSSSRTDAMAPSAVDLVLTRPAGVISPGPNGANGVNGTTGSKGANGANGHEPEVPERRVLKDVLKDLAMTQGVNAAVVVGRDGFVIDSVHAEEGIDTGALGAVISAGLGSAEVMGGELEVGGMTNGMFEFDDGIIIMSLAGDAILAVVADAEANLGMVRHQFRKRCSEVAKAI